MRGGVGSSGASAFGGSVLRAVRVFCVDHGRKIDLWRSIDGEDSAVFVVDDEWLRL